MTTQNPGSPSAIAKGCTCDPVKNRHGAGEPINMDGNIRVHIALYCPVHSDFKQLSDLS